MVTDAVGATGTAGTALISIMIRPAPRSTLVPDTTLFRSAPGATSVNVADTWNAPPSRLYSYAPSGAVTTMGPVGPTHDRRTVTDAVSAPGTAGTALTTSGVGAETQVLSVVDLAVTLCAPGATRLDVGGVWNERTSRLSSYPSKKAVTTMVPVGTAHVG